MRAAMTKQARFRWVRQRTDLAAQKVLRYISRFLFPRAWATRRKIEMYIGGGALLLIIILVLFFL
jgi:hypothetical protein